MSSTADAQHVKFAKTDRFHARLKKKVDRYFSMTRQSPRDCPQIYVKSAVILVTLAASYTLLVFGAPTFGQSLLLAAVVGISMALVGFNIQHDANHGAYSRHRWINECLGLSLDLIGGGSHMWKYKHNVVHHTFANITGHDDDIELGILGRLSPHQKWLPFHRYQHYYLWFLYGFLVIKWHLFDDFRAFAASHAGGRHFGRPRGWQLVKFVAGKLCFFSAAFVIPALIHPLWVVICYYLGIAWLAGLILSIVFQLAHSVEGASFPIPDSSTGQITDSWSVHQIETTVDFARRNWLLSWLLGGLNFQVEHHLFPRICHIHYPKIARFVRKECQKSGLHYKEHITFFSALAAHGRWLKRMGRGAATLAQSPHAQHS